jgi:hypothetical protein
MSEGQLTVDNVESDGGVGIIRCLHLKVYPF